MRVVARKGRVEVSDETRFLYQTAKWDKGAEARSAGDRPQGRHCDAGNAAVRREGVQCLDSRQRVRFGLAGDGLLLDNLGTSTGSREVELYTAAPADSLKTNGGVSEVSVSSKDVPTVLTKIA